MKKNISAALLSLACFSAVSAAAFADGPVANAINGIGAAGEDIINGAGNAVGDLTDGITGAARAVGSDDDSDPDESTSVGDDSDITSDESSDDISSDVSDDPESSDDTPAASVEESGAVGGVSGANPGTGVTYGFTAAAAVLAAVGVVAASARKDK